MEKPYLSIIIPARNEAKRISPTLVDIDRHLKSVSYAYEILVLINGTTDETEHVVERMSHVIKNLRGVVRKESFGKGWATCQGMFEARGQYKLFMDADNATSIDHFEKMIPFFQNGFDVVIGSRAIPGAKLDPPQPLFKQILGKLGNVLIQIVAVPGIKDTQCGFKCFSERAADTIFPLIKDNRWGFDIEVLALARKFHFKIKEIPVHWVNNFDSQVKLKDYISVFIETFKIRWWLVTNQYKIKKPRE